MKRKICFKVLNIVTQCSLLLFLTKRSHMYVDAKNMCHMMQKSEFSCENIYLFPSHFYDNYDACNGFVFIFFAFLLQGKHNC